MKKQIKTLFAAVLAVAALTVCACAAWAGIPGAEKQVVFSQDSTGTMETKILNYLEEQTVYVFPAGTTVKIGEDCAQIGVSKLVNNNTAKETVKGAMLAVGMSDASFAIPDDGAIYCLNVADMSLSAKDYYVTVSATAGTGTTEEPTTEEPETQEPTEPTEPAAPAFTDVAADAYYADAVKWAVEKGITTGKTDTTFAPGETCTTAHILTFLWRANGSPEPTIENPFTDVKEGDYFYKAALWAYEKELVSGNVFTPSAPCTRGQTMLFLYLLAGSPEAELSTFADVAADSVYSQAISWAVTQGITTGKTETTFAPDEICTRGHIVTFLYRAMGK